MGEHQDQQDIEGQQHLMSLRRSMLEFDQQHIDGASHDEPEEENLEVEEVLRDWQLGVPTAFDQW